MSQQQTVLRVQTTIPNVTITGTTQFTTLDLYGDYVSYLMILRKIKQLYRNYRYNTISINNTIINSKIEKDKNVIVGFNYSHPCWKPLNTLNTKYIL